MKKIKDSIFIPVTRIDQLKDGDSVTCIIDGSKITDAKISISDIDNIFICQNIKEGIIAPNRKGYRYSWKCHCDSIYSFEYMLKAFLVSDLCVEEKQNNSDMISEMRGWKILQAYSGRYSFNIKDTDSLACVEYPVNKRVYPKIENSLLFFFKEKNNAISYLNTLDFYNDLQHFIIVPCIAYDCKPMEYMANYVFKIEKFWEARENKYYVKKGILDYVPAGTWGAESITCLE